MSAWSLPACKTDPAASGNSAETAAELPADFVKFFDQFHSDSAFQVNHIIFPLEGKPATLEADTLPSAERYYWQRSDWRLHRPFADPSGEFENWFEKKDDRIIEHWIHMKGTAMYLYRRFAKLDDNWFLIYYQDMRPTAKAG